MLQITLFNITKLVLHRFLGAKILVTQKKLTFLLHIKYLQSNWLNNLVANQTRLNKILKICI